MLLWHTFNQFRRKIVLGYVIISLLFVGVAHAQRSVTDVWYSFYGWGGWSAGRTYSENMNGHNGSARTYTNGSQTIKIGLSLKWWSQKILSVIPLLVERHLKD